MNIAFGKEGEKKQNLRSGTDAFHQSHGEMGCKRAMNKKEKAFQNYL